MKLLCNHAVIIFTVRKEKDKAPSESTASDETVKILTGHLGKLETFCVGLGMKVFSSGLKQIKKNLILRGETQTLQQHDS